MIGEMDWSMVATFASGFLSGFLTKIGADWFNDLRRDRTQQSAANQRFARIEAAMPALLNEIRADLGGNSLVRDFVIPPSKRATFHYPAVHFAYYEEDHPDLAGKLAMLENSGYIEAQGESIYRMTEEFVKLLDSRAADPLLSKIN
jgi:hypothetical protein